MGQLIDVSATSIGNVAVFDLDRSLTGQDARIFTDAPQGDTPPRKLARRLWRHHPDISSVHVLSNTVTVARPDVWSGQALADATDVIANLFVHYETVSPEEYLDQLRDQNYNATITSIRAHNPDLWVMKVRPDVPGEPFAPGQYTTLGLGYWEPRADEASEPFDEDPDLWERMARRSYSVSSSIVTADGSLEPPHPEDVEFYVVRVPPDHEEVPALTPRIFNKEVGDRLYMSHKFTGRYTLDGTEPEDNVVFMSTGTGEAPQNTMTAELLRRGHQGTIINVVCVRYRADLAYTDQHRTVEDTFDNYKYLALTTREPENEGNKVYIQDLLKSGKLEEVLGAPLDPETTQVFLCGNPLMIGLPTWEDDEIVAFPEPQGVCELLHERGFTIDHRKTRGNVHYEEYWKDR